MVKQLSISGMSCGHCVKRVEKALSDLEGVTSVVVNLEANNAVVDCTETIADVVFIEALDDAGYDVEAITSL